MTEYAVETCQVAAAKEIQDDSVNEENNGDYLLGRSRRPTRRLPAERTDHQRQSLHLDTEETEACRETQALRPAGRSDTASAR